MLIKITFREKHKMTHQVITDNIDTAFIICSNMDKEDFVNNWNLDIPVNYIAWYKQELWNKMEPDFNKWDYS